MSTIESSSTVTASASSTDSPTSSSPRKTRIVRVRRDTNGVEIERTYEDMTTATATATATSRLPGIGERKPFSPLKPDAVQRRRQSLDMSFYPTKSDDRPISDNNNSNIYNYNTDSTGNGKETTTTTSPTKKKIVRVRRNSLGIEIGRTYTDTPIITSDEFSMSSNSHTDGDFQPIIPSSSLSSSPTKTRIVRIRRNSLGIETGRTYVDTIVPNTTTGTTNPIPEKDITVVNINSSGIQGNNNNNNEIDNTTIKSSSTLSPLQMKHLSPGKISSPTKVLSQRMKSNIRNEHMKIMEKSIVADSSTSVKQEIPSEEESSTVGKRTPPTTKKSIRSATLNTRAINITPMDTTTPSPGTMKRNKLKSSQLLKGKIQNIGGVGGSGGVAAGGDSHFVTSPSFRSLSMRVLPSSIGGSSESETDDHHVQSLRLLRVLLGEDKAMISKLNVDRALEKHADLLRFQLQQKKKIKQRDETIQQEKKIQEEMIEEHKKQITKLEDDMNRQKQLMQTSLEIKDVEIGILTKERDQKAIKIQQVSWRLAKERAAAKERMKSSDNNADTEFVTVCSKCQSPIDPKDDSSTVLDLIHLQTEQDTCFENDEESQATPITGHASSTSLLLDIWDKDGNVKSDVDKMAELESGVVVTELKTKLEETESQLLDAQKSILILEKKQQEMELDFEETLHESKAKVNQLKTVLVACNDRRRVAEQILRDLGKFDEVALVTASKKSPKDIDISESIAREVASANSMDSETYLYPKSQSEVEERLKEQLAEAKSLSFKLGIENEMNIQKCTATLEANAKLESQLVSLRTKLKDCEGQLVSAKSRNSEKLRVAATSIRQLEKVTAECTIANETKYAKLELQYSVLQKEMEDIQEKYSALQKELENQVNVAERELKASKEESAQLKAELGEVSKSLEVLEREISQHKDELDQARLLLQQSESMIKKYSTRVQEADALVKDYEEQVVSLTDQLKQSKLERTQADIHVPSREGESSTVIEMQSMLEQSQIQVQQYETKLEQMQQALYESEAMGEKYVAMLEEANTTLEQSEKLMKQYEDTIQPDRRLDDDNDGVSESELSESDETGTSDDLSNKSAKDLIAIASIRLNSFKINSPTKGPNSPKKSVSMVVNNANDNNSTDIDRGELAKAIAEVTELRQRVAVLEGRYKDATKKLLFLKETVLTVVDTDMSI